MPLENPNFCEIYDKVMLCAQNFPKDIVPSKFEAESVLKYGQSQPKRAYKARAYKKKSVYSRKNLAQPHCWSYTINIH